MRAVQLPEPAGGTAGTILHHAGNCKPERPFFGQPRRIPRRFIHGHHGGIAVGQNPTRSQEETFFEILEPSLRTTSTSLTCRLWKSCSPPKHGARYTYWWWVVKIVVMKDPNRRRGIAWEDRGRGRPPIQAGKGTGGDVTVAGVDVIRKMGLAFTAADRRVAGAEEQLERNEAADRSRTPAGSGRGSPVGPQLPEIVTVQVRKKGPLPNWPQHFGPDGD